MPDGLTEDIITELSRFRELLVISRNCGFRAQGQAGQGAGDCPRIRRRVRGGGKRAQGGRSREGTVQLIDGETETHVWAERYDRKLADIFEIQDEVTSRSCRRCAAASRRRGTSGAAQADREHGRVPVCADRKGPAPLVNRESNAEANHMLNGDRARPEIRPCSRLEGLRDGQAWLHGWCDEPDGRCRRFGRAATALSLDDNDADVHRILAALKLNFNEHDKATYHQERALSLNPNSDLIVVQQGEVLTWLGRPAEGIEWIRRAMRLNPYHPERFWSHLGRAQYTARLYADAIELFSKLTAPDHTHHAFLAASSAQLGNSTAAGAHAREVLQRQPTFSVESFLATLHYQQPADSEHVREGLRKAGLPE